MLDIGVFAPYGIDHNRNLAFCQDTNVHHIALSASGIAGKGTDGVPSVNTLKDLVHKYATGGVTLTALTPPRISQEAFSNLDSRKRELDVIQRIIEGMGEAGIC